MGDDYLRLSVLKRLSVVCVALGTLAGADQARAQGSCVLEAVAGGIRQDPAEGRLATEAELWAPRNIRRGPDGLIYFTDGGRHRIRRISEEGRIETVVGTGENQTAGDGLPGPEASVGTLLDLEIGSDGTLLWLETDFGRTLLRRLPPRGTVETVAGGKALGFSGDGGPAAEAGIHDTVDFAVGADDSLYLVYRAQAVANGGRIRRISPDGTIETVAGGGNISNDNFTDSLEADQIRLDRPEQIVAMSDGSFLVRSRRGSAVRRLTPEGRFELFQTRVNAFGGEADAVVPFLLDRSLSADAAGRVYWADRQGVVRTGDDLRPEVVWTRPEGAPALSSVTVLSDGSLWSARAEQIRRLVDESTVEVAAGVPRSAMLAGDGGPAPQGSFFPNTVAAAPNGGVYLSDVLTSRVRLVRESTITSFAGTGGAGEVLDGALAVDAPIPGAFEIGSDAAGNLFINAASSIWRVSASGTVARYAGDGEQCRRDNGGNCGDGGPAASASLGANMRMAVGTQGELFLFHRQTDVSARRGNVLRMVSPDGLIETLDVEAPQGLVRRMVVDAGGRLAIFRAGSPGLGQRLTESGFETIPGPPLFTSAYASAPDGSFYTAGPQRSILRVRPDGSTDTIVPQTISAIQSSGEGGPAFEAAVGSVRHLAVSPDGTLWIADSRLSRVWRIRDVSKCPDTPETTPGLFSAAPLGGLAPGVLFSMFGAGLGPAEGVVAGPDSEGRFPVEVAGTEVWISGRRAPLLFVSSGQINGVMPNSSDFQESLPVVTSAETPGWLLPVRLRRSGEAWPTAGVLLGSTAPALFALGPEQAAALNQDGTVNGPLNPAAPGEVIVLFGTGGGDMNPLPEAGRVVVGAPLPLVTQKVSAELAESSASVLYAGAAPGLVSGVLQLNILIPPNLAATGAVRVDLTIGDQKNLNQPLTVAVAAAANANHPKP